MQYTSLGRTGLKVSRLCVGTMNFGPHTSEVDSFAIMDRSLELGLNFFDTANIYGGVVEGTNYFSSKTEEIIGRWLAQGGGRRDKIVLATKMMGPLGPGPNEQGLSARHIRKACDDSLRRLRTDHIDLYQMHGFAPDTPLDEMWQAMDTLIAQGKVLYVGSSNCPGWYIVEANMTARERNMLGLVSEQCRYNLQWRRPELDLLPVAERFGVGIIPYSPLGGGLLGGGILKPSGKGRRSEEIMRMVADMYRDQVERWEALCDELGHAPARVALAWLLTRPAVTAPIFGPRTVEQVDDAVAALDVILDEDTLKKIEEIWPPFGS
jgi:NDP-hexose 2,3-enoyl reductase